MPPVLVKQIEGPLAAEFRLVTYDFRGHGGSDKILDADLYATAERFADELNAVMDAADLKRPTLVGWSFGTRIIADYLLKYGAGRIAAVNSVAPILSHDAKHFGPGIEHVMKASDDDYLTSVTATRAFLRFCFAKQPTQGEFETMLVFNANVPVKVRQWMRRTSSDAEAVQAMLKSLDVPVLLTHGARDQLPRAELSRWLATIASRARLSLYEDAGHTPSSRSRPGSTASLLHSCARRTWRGEYRQLTASVKSAAGRSLHRTDGNAPA